MKLPLSRLLLVFWLLAQPTLAYAINCNEIWTQAIRPNSPVPGGISFPAANPNFPQPLTNTDYYYDQPGSYQIQNNFTRTTSGPTSRLFINGDLTIGANTQLNSAGPPENLIIVVSGSLAIQNNVRINGFIYAAGAISIGNDTVISGGVTAGGAIAAPGAQVQFEENALTRLNSGTFCSLSLGCGVDSFSDAALSDNWVTATSSGNFTPQIVNGRLRMTQAVTNQATSVTYQRLYPALDNLVIVEFDYLAYGGNGADGMAVVLSDAAITPQPGAFGGPLGYGFKPGIPGFAGGWLGFGLDEFGNFSNEGGSTNVGRRRQAVAVRGSGSGTSGYRYLRGTCNNGTVNPNGNCLSPAVDGNQNNPHRYRIVVDSRSGSSTLVSVERNTGSGFTTLIAPFDAQSQTGQAPVPENFFLSLTGSTGGSTNIHELDNVSICALRSLPVGQQIDHFEFDYSSTPLTCKAESFTIRACANPACSELVTTPVTATLAPATLANGGWVGGNVISFSGGSTQVTLQNRTASSVTVGVTSSVPSTRPLSQTLCRRGNSTLTTQNCNVPFAASGFIFDVPDDIAGRPRSNITLSAVKQDDVTQQCIPEFANVSRNISFWSSYINPGPSGRPVSLPVQVNLNDVGLSQAQATTIPLNFNAQGRATISVNYPDAGQLELNARYVGSAATNDAGLIMTGSDRFIRRPAGLCVRTAATCNAADASCPAFAVAGDPFPLTITAHSWGNGNLNYCENPITPNFERTAIPLQLQLLAPASGALGNQGVAQYNHTRNSQAQTVVQQSVSESGVFRFGTAAFSYLGMTEQVPQAWSNSTGRFVPARFRLSELELLRTPTCSANDNLYMRQNLALSYRLTALNRQGNVTTNYHSGFVRATPVLGAASLSPAQNLADRLHFQANAGSWAAGSAFYTTASLAGESQLWLNRQSNGQPDGPYENTVLALQVLDGENPQLAAIESPDFNVLIPGCTGAQCNSRRLATYTLRYGRLALDNAFGPEFDALPLVLRAEYWQQGRFITNPFDQCSVVESGRLSWVSGDFNLAASGGSTVLANGISSPLALLLAAPGEAGSARYRYQAPPWLTYDWAQSGSYNQHPQNEVIFGRYRGNPRQIFWRER